MAPRIPLQLTYIPATRALTLSTQDSPLMAGVALLATRGLQRLVSSMAWDSSALDLLGAEEVVAVPRPVPRVQLGSGLDLLGAEEWPAQRQLR